MYASPQLVDAGTVRNFRGAKGEIALRRSNRKFAALCDRIGIDDEAVGHDPTRCLVQSATRRMSIQMEQAAVDVVDSFKTPLFCFNIVVLPGRVSLVPSLVS